jgi:hypothetical protein
MGAMDSRQPSLLDATAATRPARSRRPPAPMLPRSRRGAVEVVRHEGGPVEVKSSVRVLQADLQMAQARERCWEALARFTPRTVDDVIVPAKRDAWVARCLTTELSRVNTKR